MECWLVRFGPVNFSVDSGGIDSIELEACSKDTTSGFELVAMTSMTAQFVTRFMVAEEAKARPSTDLPLPVTTVWLNGIPNKVKSQRNADQVCMPGGKKSHKW